MTNASAASGNPVLYILDTDTMTHFRRNHPVVLANARTVTVGSIVTSVITVEEQLDGWYTLLHRARKPSEIEHAYFRLSATVQYFNKITIINYSLAAITRFGILKTQKLNIGQNDLRIGAIALEHAATVVTANTRDFSRIPGLMIEDWTM